jgi:hypothetical protein
MPKNSYYFSHDSNASHDPRILQMRSVYKAEGYGWYWMLIEQMREQENYKLPIKGKYAITAFASQMDADALRFKEFINDCVEEFKLFNRDEDYLWSNSLLNRMKIMEEKSEKAKQSALKRWESMRTHNERNAIPMQIKEKKIKEKKYIYNGDSGEILTADENKDLLDALNISSLTGNNEILTEEQKMNFRQYIEQSDNEKTNKVKCLVDIFRELHTDASPEELQNTGGKMARIYTLCNKDHRLVVKYIWDTASVGITGSHLDYIMKVIINKKKEAAKKEPVQKKSSYTKAPDELR